MGRDKQITQSFMHRLLHDKTANTLALAAAAMVPLMAMVGGGIDASRYYMASARMQAACDAGALAARRSMTGVTMNSTQRQQGFNFFDQNFHEGIFGVTGRTRNYTVNSAGVVTGTASGTLPSTIMNAFGFAQFPLSVTCSADLNISNTDIMFVLDVTGSMNCPDNNIAGCPNDNNNEVEVSNSLIVGLRTAVLSFYDSVAATASSAARVRYGMMPYANTVNVGFDIPSQFMATQHTYNSRIPIYTSNGQFSSYRYCRITTGLATNCSYTTPTGLNGWGSVDLATLYDDNRIDMPTGVSGAMERITWAGCIEEASTVRTDDFDPVPANANDLNINLVPSTAAQRWKPLLNRISWQRYDGNGYVTSASRNSTSEQSSWRMDRNGLNLCVPRARRLAEMTRSDVQNYVNGLVARGATYHDIGMIWGSRYLSPRGIFAADNTTAPNGQPIARHIVFMTDGTLAPNQLVYSPYGLEPWDFRVTSNASQSQMDDRHEKRFQAACNAAKNENFTVWVVAFGTPLTDSLRSCASPDRAFEAANNAALNQAFQRIASQIAALRLTS